MSKPCFKVGFLSLVLTSKWLVIGLLLVLSRVSIAADVAMDEQAIRDPKNIVKKGKVCCDKEKTLLQVDSCNISDTLASVYTIDHYKKV